MPSQPWEPPLQLWVELCWAACEQVGSPGAILSPQTGTPQISSACGTERNSCSSAQWVKFCPFGLSGAQFRSWHLGGLATWCGCSFRTQITTAISWFILLLSTGGTRGNTDVCQLCSKLQRRLCGKFGLLLYFQLSHFLSCGRLPWVWNSSL